jgi:hypothetical protein
MIAANIRFRIDLGGAATPPYHGINSVGPEPPLCPFQITFPWATAEMEIHAEAANIATRDGCFLG